MTQHRDTIQDAASRLSRRTFGRHTLATATMLGGLPIATRVRAETPPSPNDVLTCAVIGAGGMARFHAANTLRPYFSIRAVCDVDSTHAESFNRDFAKGHAAVFSDYRELLDHGDFDVVLVCTPDHWHTKVAVDSLRSGKDVYCEKPLTLSVAEGKFIRNVVAETKQVLQVGTQQRSDPNFQTAVALARSGKLGAIKRITAAIGGGPSGGPFEGTQPPTGLDWQQWLGQAPCTEYVPERCHGNFRWWYEYSGGKMTDWGAHHVDIAHWALHPSHDEPIHIDPVDVQLPVPFEGGKPMVDTCYNTATRFRVRCRYPSGGELVIRDEANELGFDNGLLFECEGGRFFVNRGKLTGAPIEALKNDPLDDDAMRSLRKGRDVMPHMVNFYISCHERKEGISDVASHVGSLNVCHLANIAMRLNAGVDWHPKSETTRDQAVHWLSRQQREGYEIE